jgi:hypothetical protein
MSTMDYDSEEEAKIWMKKPKYDKIRIKIEILFYIHNVDECRNIFFHYNILVASLASPQKKKNPATKLIM